MKNSFPCGLLGLSILAGPLLARPDQGPVLSLSSGRRPEAPHVVFMIGEQEYRTAETLPAFARAGLVPQGIRCTFVLAADDDPDRFDGIDSLSGADLLVLSVRRRTPPIEQMQVVRKYLASGRPLVAIRTASHAFDREPPAGHVRWADFDREILGVDYEGHYGNKPPEGPATIVRPPASATDHPILRGVPGGELTVTSHLYRSRELDPTAEILLEGRVVGRDEVEPVAWTLRRHGSRVFYTSLGSPDDFRLEAFRRLLLNAVFWALGTHEPARDGASAYRPVDRPVVLELPARRRVVGDESPARAVEEILHWPAYHTAIIICDMWDEHWCRGASRRVAEMAPRMNEVIRRARRCGVLIVHAPSDTLEAYADRIQRQRARLAPQAPDLPEGIDSWCGLMPSREGTLPVDDSDGGCDCDPVCRGRKAWSQQIATLEIAEQDIISDSGREIWNVFSQRGIDNVIVMGVHTNMCVIGRSFGIRNMVRFGKNVVLMRDLTDTMYNSRSFPFVDHFQGTELVVRHIETHWCPTIVSSAFTAKPPFRFEEDVRKHVLLALGEGLYDTATTLPAFARDVLEPELGLRFTVLHASSAGQRGLPGLPDVLPRADLLVLSVRRRSLPEPQMRAIRSHLAAGKPLVALRTSSHAFDVRGKTPPGHAEWPRFDREVLGGTYSGHHPEGPPVRVEVAPGAEDHPVASGLIGREMTSSGSLYRSSPLVTGARPVLLGTIPGEDPEPVAWTWRRDGSRIFYTSLGHPGDFENEAFRRLLTNGVRWALGMRVPRPASDFARSWHRLQVPGTWDERSHGALSDYDGFAWYRCLVRVPRSWGQRDLHLTVTAVDNAHETYFNGVFLGGAGALPPEYRNGLEIERHLLVRREHVAAGEVNLIAIRIYDHDGQGGFKGEAPILSNGKKALALEGEWQFRTGDEAAWGAGVTWPREADTGVTIFNAAATER